MLSSPELRPTNKPIYIPVGTTREQIINDKPAIDPVHLRSPIQTLGEITGVEPETRANSTDIHWSTFMLLRPAPAPMETTESDDKTTRDYQQIKKLREQEKTKRRADRVPPEQPEQAIEDMECTQAIPSLLDLKITPPIPALMNVKVLPPFGWKRNINYTPYPVPPCRRPLPK
jgi:hypothetical protein